MTAEDLFRSFTAGVDRSPTEIAALYLEVEPAGDPVRFLTDNGCAADEAKAAVGLLDRPKRSGKAKDEVESDPV